MNAQKVNQVMPAVYAVLRTHPILQGVPLLGSKLLSRIIYISLLHSANSKSKAVYCVSSERYLAQTHFCARETVSRNIKMLKSFGLLDVTQRRPENGRWSTNLYKFGKLLWVLIQDVTSRFFSSFNRVTSTSHIGTENHSKLTSRQQNKVFLTKNSSPPLDYYLTALSKKMGFEG